MIVEVNAALHRKIEELEEEVKSLLEQRKFLAAEAHAFRRIRKELRVPRQLFFGGDHLLRLHEVVRREDFRAMDRECLAREVKRLAKGEPS